MNFNTPNIRISQLPMAMFGITHDVPFNGIRVSIFTNTNTTIRREDSPALT
ncbi:RAxF-45 family protein [Paenibacillus sp. KS1]|uniref:RAxF-45 family protein n=1 Tax=Paenibacillus sp. KS1 TaxID=1849249 RepID=UPI000AF50EBF|nr:RAxF-45 family protein [Paenibacillus sp. KS1]